MQETHTGPAVPWREKHILLVTPRQCTFDRDRGGLPSFIVILRRWSPDLSPPQWVPRLDNGSPGPLSFAGLVVGAFRGRADMIQLQTWGLARMELTCVVSALAASTSALTFHSTGISR